MSAKVSQPGDANAKAHKENKLAYVEGLSGTEIIEDVVAQVRRKLLQDCNLRATDSYGKGFSAKIQIEIKAFAMDTVAINQTAEIAAKEPPPEPTEKIAVIPVEIKQELDIPQEENLTAVRERLDDPEPVLATGGEEPATQLRTKRKYTRTKTLEHMAAGGAVDLTTEF